MELTKKQSVAISSNARWKVWNFGRRSGKTTGLAWEAFITAMNVDNAKVTYYAQTFDDARNIAWDIFLEVFGKAVISKNETRLEIKVRNLKKGVSTIMLKGWESVVTSEKGRGTENDLILCDEVAFCRGFKQYWDTVLEPTLLTTRGRAVFSSTPNGFNDFYELANKAQTDDDWLYVHATSYDNPFNPAEELDRLKEEKTDDAFAQEYMADFRKQEGLVYKEFNRYRHIFSKDPQNIIKTFGGLDFGFTNPCGALTIKKDKWAVYWVTFEWYKTSQTDAQIADYIAALKWEECYPDPESPSGIEELRKRGVNVREVIKHTDSIRNGISTVRELFKANRLRIHNSCSNFIWEIETYSYPNSKPNQPEYENPIKKDDHLLDALRYALSKDNALTSEQYHPTSVWDLPTQDELSTNPAE